MDARSLELLRLNGADVPDAGAMLLVEADGDHDTLPYLLQALANAAHNATNAQQQSYVTAQAATTMGVATLYSIDTATTGVATKQILGA